MARAISKLPARKQTVDGGRVKVDTTPDIFGKIIDLAFFYREQKQQTQISWRMDNGAVYTIHVDPKSSVPEMVAAIKERLEQDGCSAEGQEGRCP
jgi:hypothetical protein